MKIADLKQPYRRMAEYFADKNTDECYDDKKVLCDAFNWEETNDNFWNDINEGYSPLITEGIKQYFPPDFDFSGEEEKFHLSNNPIIQNRIYTQLAKEGKFEELPDTCEFSEAVELEVWDDELQNKRTRLILGKFKGAYLEEDLTAWNFAQLPTPKIDFSEFKTGDVVEVELSNEEKRIGWFDYTDRGHVVIKTLKRKGNQVCNGGGCAGSKMLNKEKIKSITKIK